MKIINILIYVAMLLVLVTFFTLVYKLLNDTYNRREDILKSVNKQFAVHGEMSAQKKKLSKLGIMYRTHNYNLSPGYYLSLRIAVGVVGAAFLCFLAVAASPDNKFIAIPVGFLIGFFGTHFYFVYENKQDNEEMIMDIYNTYANIKIQMAAGIYIREVLEYTYKMAVSERYKEAIAELVLNFSDKTISSTEAITIFKNRFDSTEIDKLSSMLGSFMQYGLNADHADDIMIEIQGLIQAATLKAEHDIESKAGFVNFLFFVVIIAMVIFIVFSSFSVGGIF